MHATADLDGLALPALRPTAGELLAMAEELAFLVRAQRLGSDTAERLTEAARARDPGHALYGIVHGDFCAENFVIDGDGRLRVVDNEGIELGPLVRDLARVWTRWPMPASEWERFVAAYRSAGGAHAEGPEFALWKIRRLSGSGNPVRVTMRSACTD
jgi:aminoglycoside phosphotransferase (APT) family kinase protein